MGKKDCDVKYPSRKCRWSLRTSQNLPTNLPSLCMTGQPHPRQHHITPNLCAGCGFSLLPILCSRSEHNGNIVTPIAPDRSPLPPQMSSPSHPPLLQRPQCEFPHHRLSDRQPLSQRTHINEKLTDSLIVWIRMVQTERLIERRD